MKKYLLMSSASVVIGALRVKKQIVQWFIQLLAEVLHYLHLFLVQISIQTFRVNTVIRNAVCGNIQNKDRKVDQSTHPSSSI